MVRELGYARNVTTSNAPKQVRRVDLHDTKLYQRFDRRLIADYIHHGYERYGQILRY